MADFEQPEGYTFIDDGRLPEEQPGVIFDGPMRIAESARRHLEPASGYVLDAIYYQHDKREKLGYRLVAGGGAIEAAGLASDNLFFKIAGAALLGTGGILVMLPNPPQEIEVNEVLHES